MKLPEELQKDLARDLVLNAVRSRRHRRVAVRAAAATALVALLLLPFLDRPAPGNPAPEVSKVEIVSDEELLAALSDQQPVLVRYPDGSEELFLLAPRKTGFR